MDRVLIALAALMSLMLVGCSQPPPDDEEVVAQRSQERWDALVASDFESAYTYRSPAYREETSEIEHIVGLSRRRIVWISADVTAVECEEARCEVTVSVGYRADGAPGQMAGMENVRPVREIWVRLEDQWWYSDTA